MNIKIQSIITFLILFSFATFQESYSFFSIKNLPVERTTQLAAFDKNFAFNEQDETLLSYLYLTAIPLLTKITYETVVNSQYKQIYQRNIEQLKIYIDKYPNAQTFSMIEALTTDYIRALNTKNEAALIDSYYAFVNFIYITQMPRNIFEKFTQTYENIEKLKEKKLSAPPSSKPYQAEN